MATLSTAQRKRLPAKAHAKNAKARASQMYKEGRITREERDRIFKKADRVLYGGNHADHGHVYLVDDSGREAPRGRVKPDGQPSYKIQPEGMRRHRGAENAKAT